MANPFPLKSHPSTDGPFNGLAFIVDTLRNLGSKESIIFAVLCLGEVDLLGIGLLDEVGKCVAVNSTIVTLLGLFVI